MVAQPDRDFAGRVRIGEPAFNRVEPGRACSGKTFGERQFLEQDGDIGGEPGHRKKSGLAGLGAEKRFGHAAKPLTDSELELDRRLHGVDVHGGGYLDQLQPGGG